MRDLFFALLGHTRCTAASSGIVHANNTEDSQQRLFTQLLPLGHYYYVIRRFVCHCAQTSEPYLHAFGLGLDECLQPYRASLLALEQQALCAELPSLAALPRCLVAYEITLPALHRLLQAILHNDVQGMALLDLLQASADGCVHNLRACTHVILRHTQRIFRAGLIAWLLHGEIIRASGFFVRLTRPSRASIRSKDAQVRAHEHRARLSDAKLEGDRSDGGPCAHDQEWFAYDMEIARKPASITACMAKRVLFIGKVVRILRVS